MSFKILNIFVIDVARFMLTAAENPDKWKRKAVAVSTNYTKEEASEALERLFAHMAKK